MSTATRMDPAAITATASSPFSRLSAELRNRIYELAMRPSNVEVDQYYFLPRLLMTYKQIHEESVQLYYNTMTFSFISLETCVRWLSNLPEDNKRALSAVRLETAKFFFETHCATSGMMFGLSSVALNQLDELQQRWHVHYTRRQLRDLVEDISPRVIKVDQVQTCFGNETPEEKSKWLDDLAKPFKRVWVDIKEELKFNEFQVSLVIMP